MTCEQCKNFKRCIEEANYLGQAFDPNYDGEHRCASNEFQAKTNADRIRATMSDQELAEHNIHFVRVWDQYNDYYEPVYQCSDGYTSYDYQGALEYELDWLQQPATED